MGSFIDTLGRLTDEQSARIAKEARKHELEQQRLAVEDIDRLHREDVLKAKELEVLEYKMAERRETLSMAWLGAEFLKAANVSRLDWVDIAPKFQTKGFFSRQQELVGRQERFVFDAWKLEELNAKSTVRSDFYASSQTELVLTTDGEIGIAKKQRYIEGDPKTLIEYRVQSLRVNVTQRRLTGRSIESLSDEEMAVFEAQYLASDGLREDNTLSLLSRHCSGDEEQLIRAVYDKSDLGEITPKLMKVLNPLLMPLMYLYDRFEKVESVTDALVQAYGDRLENKRQSFNVDKHLRLALANLLALNDIKIL